MDMMLSEVELRFNTNDEVSTRVEGDYLVIVTKTWSRFGAVTGFEETKVHFTDLINVEKDNG